MRPFKTALNGLSAVDRNSPQLGTVSLHDEDVPFVATPEQHADRHDSHLVDFVDHDLHSYPEAVGTHASIGAETAKNLAGVFPPLRFTAARACSGKSSVTCRRIGLLTTLCGSNSCLRWATTGRRQPGVSESRKGLRPMLQLELVQQKPLLDLDYREHSDADADDCQTIDTAMLHVQKGSA